MKQKIAIASDHGGYQAKEQIKAQFPDYEWIDLGTNSSDSVDYPDYAHKMCDTLKSNPEILGVLICGTGIGISITANRHNHIRAALCTDSAMARLTRAHNDANVLTLGARITGMETIFDIVQTFLNTEFEGGRHVRRINKINI